MKVQIVTPYLVCLCALFMAFLDRFLPLAEILPFPYSRVGILLLVPGLGITITGVGVIQRAATTLHTFKQPLTLITEGLYHYSRNPVYLGLLMGLIGFWFLLGSLSPLIFIVVFFSISNYWYIPTEERMLTARFGATYRTYQNHVRRWL